MGVKPFFQHCLQALLPSWIYVYSGKLGRDVQIGYRRVSFEETRVSTLALEKESEEFLVETRKENL